MGYLIIIAYCLVFHFGCLKRFNRKVKANTLALVLLIQNERPIAEHFAINFMEIKNYAGFKDLIE